MSANPERGDRVILEMKNGGVRPAIFEDTTAHGYLVRRSEESSTVTYLFDSVKAIYVKWETS